MGAQPDLINAKLWSRHWLGVAKEAARDLRGDRYPGGRFAYAEALIERAERLFKRTATEKK